MRFTVRNTGSQAGTEIAQVYVALPATAKEDYKRMVAWQRVKLAPGESKEVTLKLNLLYLSVFNTDNNAWQLLPGEYKVMAGTSSSETPLTATLHVQPQQEAQLEVQRSEAYASLLCLTAVLFVGHMCLD